MQKIPQYAKRRAIKTNAKRTFQKSTNKNWKNEKKK